MTWSGILHCCCAPCRGLCRISRSPRTDFAWQTHYHHPLPRLHHHRRSALSPLSLFKSLLLWSISRDLSCSVTTDQASPHPFRLHFEQLPTWTSQSPFPCASLLVAPYTQPKATATDVSPLVLHTTSRRGCLSSSSLISFDPFKPSRSRASMYVLMLTSEPARPTGGAAGA